MVHVARRAGRGDPLGAGLAGARPTSPSFASVFGPSDWLRGPGDDGAVVSVGDEEVIACGEAILPAFVEHDPVRRRRGRRADQRERRGRHGRRPLGHRRHHRGAARDVSRRARRDALRLRALRRARRRGPSDEQRRSRRAVGLRPRPLPGPPRCRRPAWRPGNGWRSSSAWRGGCASDFPFFPSFDERGRDSPATCACSPISPPTASSWRPRTSAWPGSSARSRCCWSRPDAARRSPSSRCRCPTGVDVRRVGDVLPVLRLPGDDAAGDRGPLPPRGGRRGPDLRAVGDDRRRRASSR